MQYHTLGTLIRLHRENLEMSRAELARQVGVHPSQLTRWAVSVNPASGGLSGALPRSWSNGTTR
jgi:DNA-binding transcriptional regulator YiaG